MVFHLGNATEQTWMLAFEINKNIGRYNAGLLTANINTCYMLGAPSTSAEAVQYDHKILRVPKAMFLGN